MNLACVCNRRFAQYSNLLRAYPKNEIHTDLGLMSQVTDAYDFDLVKAISDFLSTSKTPQT